MKRPAKTIYVNGVAARILAKKWAFAGVFFLVFFVSYASLYALGIAPGQMHSGAPLYVPDGGAPFGAPTQEDDFYHLSEGEGEMPVRIEIPSLGIRATVANPTNASVSALDQALLSGTVRYPGSGVLGEEGNVLIFGHSSNLPVVHNQAFRAFNDIQNLKKGEVITVYGTTRAYAYEVVTIEQANASTDAIPLVVNGAYLTLATCNNFGSKEDRFIVTAKLVATQEL